MVKYCFIAAVTLLIASCQEQAKAPTQEESVFDTSSYKKDSYAERVYDFLSSRKETKSEKDYTAIFVNTSTCSVCTMGDFEEITPYLDKTKEKIFVFANDSSVLKGYNENLKFILLEKKEYKSKQIFHEKIYLYEVSNGKAKAIPLARETIDSLNATVK
jgi:hypothetical protein